MDIKTPKFDKPIALSATGERRLVDPTTVPIEVGTLVILVYLGKHMTADITTVEEPDSQFVGCVRDFENHELEHGDLKHGDHVRFQKDDIRHIG